MKILVIGNGLFVRTREVPGKPSNRFSLNATSAFDVENSEPVVVAVIARRSSTSLASRHAAWLRSGFTTHALLTDDRRGLQTVKESSLGGGMP